MIHSKSIRIVEFMKEMNVTHLPRNISWLLLLLMPTLVWGQGGGDFVQTIGNAPSFGTIRSMSANEIIISSNGRDLKVPVNELKNVSFRNEPSELKRARLDIANGNYNAALTKLRKLEKTELQSAYVKQDMEFYEAFAGSQLALAGALNPKEVAAKMFSFVKTSPDNYHYYEALDVLGRLALAMGKYSTAEGFFGKLAKAPWKNLQWKAISLRATAQLQQGKHSEALRNFEQVANSDIGGVAGERQKSLAQVGMVACWSQTGETERGIELAKEVIKQSEPDEIELNARAYNALGNCFLKQKKLKYALLAFLQTDLLYQGQGDAHAESLYQLTKLWQQLDKHDRARQARNVLKERYSNSLWAKRM
jgi:tetratricopeptide (TPR) repeat protein